MAATKSSTVNAMRPVHARVRAAASPVLSLAVALALGGCGSKSLGTQATAKDFNRHNFSNPTKIDNKWLPMVPGTQLVYEGHSNLGGGLRPHRVVFTVTDLTKVIDGIRTRAVWDRDFHEGRLEEAELAFFAQDNDGNIWALGEYPEEHDSHGRLAWAPNTWIVGANAKPGINIRGNPRLGTSDYSHG